MTENIPAWTLWVPAIAAIGSSFVTGFIALWTTRQARITEEKKHLRTLLFNTAIENWKTRVDIIKDSGGAVMPLDSFIIHMYKLSAILNDDITKDNISNKVKEIREFTNAIESAYKEIKK